MSDQQWIYLRDNHIVVWPIIYSFLDTKQGLSVQDLWGNFRAYPHLQSGPLAETGQYVKDFSDHFWAYHHLQSGSLAETGLCVKHQEHLRAYPHLTKVSNIGFITVHGLNEGHIAPYTYIEFQLAKYLTYITIKS